ncbi:MAG: NAD(P)-dependent oxidoreductase [Gemmatimonadetes bacterium]|nr:NAD(P)-dependent oxidoreductase [Gemmatimonadota bacterium]MBT6149621.1 NAD(P)-dependent oxidoreductase [Gemmatimonadota bacterium]MBT7862320.1 NAD(P)-dependent oxidoreductase [Gemmatimonadota bacterium]
MTNQPVTMQGSCIAVTGAWGNLGTKLLQHLSASGCAHLLGIDAQQVPDGLLEKLHSAAVEAGHPPPIIEAIRGDLTDWQDHRWRDGLARADGVVHFAAQNPFPEASWDDACASIDMNLHVGEAALASGTTRLVFASSNHVMGRYRTAGLGPGELTPDLMPGVGTIWQAGMTQMDSTVYAMAKIAGERICHGVAARSEGRLSCVCIRIGWCQPGQNHPSTLNASGTPTQASVAAEDEESAATGRWFRGMWLSNRDFCQLHELALVTPRGAWPSDCLLVNGVSGNRDSVWSLESARRWLRYEPVDDVEASSSSISR